MALLGCAAGGCSMSLDSMFGGSDKTEAASKKPSNPAALPPEADLAFTRAAVNEMLARGQTDASVPWENPQTGARGTVTAIASAYTLDNSLCRDFLASYLHGGNETWLRGEACRQARDRWEVRELKPWSNS